MNAVVRNVVVGMALDLVVDILKDMATPEGVTKFREEVINLGTKLTSKSANDFDDRAWKWVAMNLLTPGNWSMYGGEAVVWMKNYVMDSATKYDDYTLPILVALESAFAE